MATSFALRGRVALLRITKPPVNSLGLAVRKGIFDGLDAAEREGAQAIVLAGAGATFPAGADISEFATGGHMEFPPLGAVIERISALEMHSVAAVHGTALGGGMELALGCHYRLMHQGAKFGLPEVHLGILPGAGGTQRLPRLVGCEAAIQMMTSGAMINAKKALASGLCDEVVGAATASPSDDVVEAAIRFCEEKLVGTPVDGSRVVAERRLDDPGVAFFTGVKEQVRAKARGELAPLQIVDAVQAACGAASFEEGLREEQRLFAELAAGPQAGALQQVFQSERLIGKIDGLAKDVRPLEVRRAAVIGAGTMGGGIAMCFAEAGIDVTLVDRDEASLARGLAIVRANWEASAKKGKISADDVEARVGRIATSTSYASGGVAEADVVVEAAFERMEVKRAIFAALDEHCKPGALLASNTSTLSIDEIAASTTRPESVVGMHFFSPANVMPLLENVRGAASSDVSVATAMALGKRLRKKSVLAGNCFGFIGNRMLEYYLHECMFMVEEGATPQQVDGVMRAHGLAMGPFAMSDLAGNDIGYNIRKDWGWDPDFAAREGRRYWAFAVDKLVEAGRLGQKAKKGWYDYSAGRKPVVDPEVEALIVRTSEELGITRRAFTDEEILDRCLLPLVNEGFKIVEEGIAQRESDLNIVYLYGYGFPRRHGGPMHWARHVREGGLPKVVADLQRYAEAHPNVPHWKPSELLLKEAAKAEASS